MGEVMNGIETMSRDDLENFAKNTIVALQMLEIENKQLLFDIESSATVDVKVINGWRDLVNSSDQEREKWSQLATEMAEKNQLIVKTNEKLRFAAEKILTTLDSIAKTAHDNADPRLKALKLSRKMKRIEDEANAAKSEILEFFADEPDIEPDEQS